MMIAPVNISCTYTKCDKPYDICEINGSKFLLVHEPICSDKKLYVNFEGYNVVFLAPIVAESDLTINAITVVVLTRLEAKEGNCHVEASGKFISVGGKAKAKGEVIINSKLDQVVTWVYKDRLKRLKEGFAKGIEAASSKDIVDALLETYDACVDPGMEDENDVIEHAKAFEFFGIATEIEQGVEAGKSEDCQD